MLRWVRLLLVSLLLLHGAQARPAVLTQAVQILRLSAPEAQAGPSARVKGVILSGAELGPNTFVLHDGTAAIYVLAAKAEPGVVARSNLVEVVGRVDAGQFAPLIAAEQIWLAGSGAIPVPKRVTYDQLFSGEPGARWVEVQGIVRSCAYLPGAFAAKTVLVLATGGGRLVVEATGPELPAADWVDSEVRVRGICFYQFNQNRQLYDVVLVVPSGEQIVQERPPEARPFDTPPVPIGSLLQFGHQGSFGHRSHVEGIVLFQQTGEFLYIRDATRALQVCATQNTPVAPGTRVGVVGFAVPGDYSPLLEDAVFRILPGAPEPITPIHIDRPDQALTLDSELVRLQALVVGHVQQPDGWAVSLQQGDMVFNAFLRSGDAKPPFPNLAVGTTVELTGICTVVMGYWVPRGGLRIPQSFRLLLRSASDLRVIQIPPWWTRTRVVIVLATAVVSLALLAGAIVLVARMRLLQQQRERRQAETEFAAILNERNRLARELHDTLAQDLAALSAQLEAARARLPPDADSARTQLQEARSIVRSSLAEARRSIFNMRSQVLEQKGLAQALSDLLKQEARGLLAQFELSGEPRRLSAALENDLLRIGQEAIHNAVRHGRPRHIELSLEFHTDRVRLQVKDDGNGFQLESNRPERTTHFGLTGMRERARRHGTELRLVSTPGNGTTVSVEMAVRGSPQL